ncbi:MAG TPA: hypothetical protein VK879_19200 [Candidatus Sulfomarinibacteraceae bacterium]|nr:hypothetical protein [Candidatus Sulfomarinibacteraceae bacterium]
MMDERTLREILDEVAAEDAPHAAEMWPEVERRVRQQGKRRRFYHLRTRVLPAVAAAVAVLLLVGLYGAWLSGLRAETPEGETDSISQWAAEAGVEVERRVAIEQEQQTGPAQVIIDEMAVVPDALLVSGQLEIPEGARALEAGYPILWYGEERVLGAFEQGSITDQPETPFLLRFPRSAVAISEALLQFPPFFITEPEPLEIRLDLERMDEAPYTVRAGDYPLRFEETEATTGGFALRYQPENLAGARYLLGMEDLSIRDDQGNDYELTGGSNSFFEELQDQLVVRETTIHLDKAPAPEAEGLIIETSFAQRITDAAWFALDGSGASEPIRAVANRYYPHHQNGAYMAPAGDQLVDHKLLARLGMTVIAPGERAPDEAQIVYFHPDVINEETLPYISELYQAEKIVVVLNTPISELRPHVPVVRGGGWEDFPSEFFDGRYIVALYYYQERDERAGSRSVGRQYVKPEDFTLIPALIEQTFAAQEDGGQPAPSTAPAETSVPPTPTVTTTRPAPSTQLQVPEIKMTLQDVNYAPDETVVEVRTEIDGRSPPSIQPRGAGPVAWTLVDEQDRQYDGRRVRGGCDEEDNRLVCKDTFWFEPVADDAATLTLEVVGLDVRWPAGEPLVLDLQGRQHGDRWSHEEELSIMSMRVPLTEAAWVTDPDGLDGHLSLQITAPCVAQDAAQLLYLDTWLVGQRSGSDGVGAQSCDRPDAEQLVAAFTVDSLLDGRTPATLEIAVVEISGRIRLHGSWTLNWEVER